jgi:hypothetical protein
VNSVEEEKDCDETLFLACAFAMAFIHAGCGADKSTADTGLPNSSTNASPLKAQSMKIRLKVEDKVMTATLIDSKTTRDFVSLLPLTMTMNDLFQREKFAHLPRPISEEGKRTHTYEVGQVIYWSPARDVAIYYRNDGEKIPNPGIIVIGKIESGVAALDVPGSVKVTIELHDEQ